MRSSKFNIYFLKLCFILATVNSASTLPPENEWYHYGKYYYKIFNISANFFDAEKSCQSFSAHLASFENVEELNMLHNLANRFSLVTRQYWLGLFNKNETNEEYGYNFYFTDNTKFDAKHWRESNNYFSMQIDFNEGDGSKVPESADFLFHAEPEDSTSSRIFCSSMIAIDAITNVDCAQKRSAHVCKVPQDLFTTMVAGNTVSLDAEKESKNTESTVPQKVKTTHFPKIFSLIQNTKENLKMTSRLGRKSSTAMHSSGNSNLANAEITAQPEVDSDLHYNANGVGFDHSFFITRKPEQMAVQQNDTKFLTVHRQNDFTPIKNESYSEVNSDRVKFLLKLFRGDFGVIAFFFLLCLLFTIFGVVLTTVYCCYRQERRTKKYAVYRAYLSPRKVSTAV